MTRNDTRPALLLLLGAVAAILFALAVSGAHAQRRRRTPPPPPPIEMEGTVVTWSLFVSAYGDTPAVRTSLDAPTSGPIPVPLAGWTCIYGATNRARLNDTTWSELRSIECTHGTDVVSTSGYCQIIGNQWGPRAGTLTLGSTTSASRLNISLDCEVH